MRRFMNGETSEDAYYAYQKSFMKEEFEETTGLQVYIKDFEKLRLNIDCPVIAIFGEKDINLDWKKTQQLYEKTLGKNTDLTLKSFPDGNHNLVTCQTGGFYEMQDEQLPWTRCDGFLETMSNWLQIIE